MISTLKIQPRYAETDQMGIIHHSIYAQYYEMGRVQFCLDMKLPFDEIERRGLRLALIDIHSVFKKPLVFGKTYIQETKLIFNSRIKMILTYDIYDQNRILMHQGTTTLCWLDQTLKPVNILKINPEVYEIFNHHLEGEVHD